MAITDKQQGVWILDEVYNKINEGDIWSYVGSNELYGFGRNHKGQLGQNNTIDRSSPVQVSGTNWKYLQARFSTSAGFMATKTDGSLWSWGYNWGGGAMLNISSGSRSSPVQVGTDTNWNSVSSTYWGTLGSKTDGTLWSWGINNDGSLGLNQANGAGLSSPTQIPGAWIDPTNEYALTTQNNRRWAIRGT